MKKIDFNHGWTVRRMEDGCEARPVTLPHDAMLSEKRDNTSTGEGNIGWYSGGDYEYVKVFDLPDEYRGKRLLLRFESVYREAEVFINDAKVAARPYGYSEFYVDAAPFLKDKGNVIRVIARNSHHPSSRWYPGTGIFRPVDLFLGEALCIPPDGVKITTLSVSPAEVEIRVRTSAPGRVRAVILYDDEPVAEAAGESRHVGPFKPIPANFGSSAQTLSPAQQCENEAVLKVTIPSARLWSTETPALYTVRLTIGEDCHEERFGLRSLTWDARRGLTINGERVILRGACIHHDNGLLGACSFPEAERRRVRILKENGYNALRSAHNPCSRALLEACDAEGMLMMDEFVDAWYIHKTKYDYVDHLKDWWQDDLRDMTEKDYNHPSVILYSTGNEVAETSQPQGIAFTREMTDYLHAMDPTRPVTCGINIFFNFLFSIGFGVYSDDKAEKAAPAPEKEKPKKKHVGSDFYNTLALAVGDSFMKFGATLHGSDVKTRDAFANMDIAGYNYGLWRYKKDLKKYPQRLILGTETFCKDAYSFWKIAKDNPRIIGDFVWTGMDYIGETGEGAAEYADYKGEEPCTRMTGGNGRVDLLGKPKAEAAYTRVAFEREPGPFIAVDPVYEDEKLGLSGWQLTKSLESWAWRGCEGRKARVTVYAKGAEAELLINGKSLGRRKIKGCSAVFKTTYENGEVTAVTYDEGGGEIGRRSLRTAGEKTQLRVLPEAESVSAEGLVFIPIRYTDPEGVWKPMEKHRLTVAVANGALVGLGSACPYTRGNYTDEQTDTYFGEAMAIVRADGSGDVTVRVSDESTSVATVIQLK